MTFWKWSKTAATNGTADSTCPFPEGMAPSALNDGTRGMMAALAKYRDDTAGNGMITSGTSTAYSLSSNQVFDSVAHMIGAEITIYAHATNGAAPTLNVDGLGAFPIYTDSGSPVQAGTLIVGSIYTLLFNTTQWLLKDFYGQPFTVPIGGMIDYFGTTAPSSNFVLPFGQAISRTTYSALFTLFSTTFGTGDGSTTFNIPDLRGRVIAGKDDMGGSAIGRIGSVVTDIGTIVGTTLGSTGGSPTHVLTTAEMPTHNHGVTDPGHAHGYRIGNSGTPGSLPLTASSDNLGGTTQSATTGISIQNAGSGSAHAILQPTIIANKLLRII